MVPQSYPNGAENEELFKNPVRVFTMKLLELFTPTSVANTNFKYIMVIFSDTEAPS